MLGLVDHREQTHKLYRQRPKVYSEERPTLQYPGSDDVCLFCQVYVQSSPVYHKGQSAWLMSTDLQGRMYLSLHAKCVCVLTDLKHLCRKYSKSYHPSLLVSPVTTSCGRWEGSPLQTCFKLVSFCNNPSLCPCKYNSTVPLLSLCLTFYLGHLCCGQAV